MHEAASSRRYTIPTPELLHLQCATLAKQRINHRLDVAWPPSGLQRSTAFRQMMGQDKFSLRIASYQSQAPTQNRGCQASI